MTDRLTCEEIRDLAPSFVLGALEPEEVEAVRAHLAECPEAHDEYAELGSVVPALALAPEAHEPTAALKDRILAAAAADRAEWRSPVAAGGVAPEAPIPFRAAQHAGGTPLVGWAMRIAAVIAIVSLVGWNVLLQGRLDASETYARDVAAVLAAAAEPGALTAVLAPAEGDGGRGLAAIGTNGAVTIAMRELVPTAGDEVYEAWLIVGDEAPVPIGGFRVGEGGTGRLDGSGPTAPEGAIVALTREPGPGATAPTTPVLALGVAGAPPSS